MLIPVIQITGSIMIIPEYGITGVAWVTLFVYTLDFILYFLAYRRVVKSAAAQIVLTRFARMGDSKNIHSFGSGFFERPDTGLDRTAGGYDIVHQ